MTYGGLNQTEFRQRSTESLMRTSANFSARTTAALTMVTAWCSPFTTLNIIYNCLALQRPLFIPSVQKQQQPNQYPLNINNNNINKFQQQQYKRSISATSVQYQQQPDRYFIKVAPRPYAENLTNGVSKLATTMFVRQNELKKIGSLIFMRKNLTRAIG